MNKWRSSLDMKIKNKHSLRSKTLPKTKKNVNYFTLTTKEIKRANNFVFLFNRTSNIKVTHDKLLFITCYPKFSQSTLPKHSSFFFKEKH